MLGCLVKKTISSSKEERNKVTTSSNAITRYYDIDKTKYSAKLQGSLSTNQYVTVGLEQGKNNYFKDYSDPTKSDYRSKETTQNSVCAQDTI